MSRKRWSPVVEVTDSIIKLREKKRWQIALRRYVVEQRPSYEYAPFFGLGIADIRTWFELQFDHSMTWENFGQAWQFEHILPSQCFDFSLTQDMQLCWHFLNLKVTPTDTPPLINPVGYARTYFESLAGNANLPILSLFLEKIRVLQIPGLPSYHSKQAHFLQQKSSLLTQLTHFDAQSFAQMNAGQEPSEILKEITLLKKYSS